MIEQPIVKIRASSLGGLLDCAHKWEAQNLLGMRGKSSAPAHLGTSIHAGTARYDTDKMIGITPSASDAVDVFVDTLKESDVDWRYSDVSYKSAEQIGITLTNKYCKDISPMFNYVGVEMETKPFDILVDGTIIQLTGTMDRARAIQGAGVGIADVKSGRRAVDKETGKAHTKGHAPQLGIYELLYEHTSGLKVTEPAMIIGLQTTTSAETGTGIITNAREQLLGDGENVGLLEYAAMYIKEGKFPPNPKSSLCSEKFCPRWQVCRFKE